MQSTVWGGDSKVTKLLCTYLMMALMLEMPLFLSRRSKDNDKIATTALVSKR